jgi:hypothetical protein
MTVVLEYGFRIRSYGLYELQILDASECCGWVPEDARVHMQTEAEELQL